MRKGRITYSMLGSILIFAKTHEDKLALAKKIIGLDKMTFTDEACENMKIGVEYEDLIRQEVSKTVGMKVYEAGFCIYRENPIFGGSPDGVFEDGSILEIKITSKENPKYACSDYSEIPLWYRYQMLGNMFTMDSSNCIYSSYSRADGSIYIRHYPYDHNKWMNECYIPCNIFHRDYIMPLLKNYNLLNPYETYCLMIQNENNKK